MSETPDRQPSSSLKDRLSARFSDFHFNLKKEKIAPTFWTTASVISLAINLVLVIVALVLTRYVFAIKQIASDQLVGGLYSNFVKMDNAHILTTIQVDDSILVSDTIKVVDTIPVVFDLPLKQKTTVKLVDDTPIMGATTFINGSLVKLDIILPKDTPLNISLNLKVPVNQEVPVTLNVPVQMKVPVHLNVPVDIPLNQTQLHEPFTGLKEVVSPYHQLLSSLPDKPENVSFCGPLTNWLCRLFFISQ